LSGFSILFLYIATTFHYRDDYMYTSKRRK
jgi:hypothetical protein